MKKSIASTALLVAALSGTPFARPANPRPLPTPQTKNVLAPEQKVYCLSLNENADGSVALGTCDQTERNLQRSLPLNENKCADGQASFTSVEVKIKSCPTYVQL